MPGVPANIEEHRCDVMKGARPVKQALRCFATEKRRAIGEDICSLAP